jgi:hypothetical protein
MNFGFASEKKKSEVLSQNIFQSPQKDLFLTKKCILGSCVFWPWKRIVTVPMAHQSQGNQYS